MVTRHRLAAMVLSAGLTLGLGAASGGAPALAGPSGDGNAASSVIASGQWRRLATVGAGPSERSAPAVAAVDRYVYVFGGVHDDLAGGVNTFLDDVHRLDTVGRRWQELTTRNAPPPARAFAATAAHQPSFRIFVFGGSTFSADGSEFSAFDDLWAFETYARAWRRLTPANEGPGARTGAVMWTVGDTLYVFGGLDATFATHNDLWAYHLRTNRWEEVSPDGDPSAPPPRHVAAAGQRATGGVLTLYGGEAFDFETGFSVLADTWQYDLVAGRWREVTPTTVDPPRNYAAAGLIGDALYLHGGDAAGGSPGCGSPFPNNPVGDLWRLDTRTGSWRQVVPGGEPVPALKRHGAAVVGRAMYVVSGWDFQCEAGEGPGQVWNLDTYIFTP